MTSLLLLLTFGLLIPSYANAGSCGIAGDPRVNMVLDVDELEDRDDIQMSFIGGKHVDAENEAEAKEKCMKACCDEEQCNIASFDAGEKSDKNCYLMKCSPLDKCLWTEEEGKTSMIVKRDTEDQSHVSVTSQSNETPPSATPMSSPQADPGACSREGDLHKDQILDVDTLEDADDVNIMFLSATHVDGGNEEEGIENCMKACCSQGQCNIATLMDFKAEKNCYMMKCSPLDKCIWKAEGGRTSMVVKRDVTNQMPGNNDDKPAQGETEHVATPTPEKPTNPPPSPIPDIQPQETKVVTESPKAESANPTTPGKPQEVPSTNPPPTPVNVPQTPPGGLPAFTQASTVPPAPTEKPTSVSTTSPTAPPAPSEAPQPPADTDTKAPATQPAATEAPRPTPAQTMSPATQTPTEAQAPPTEAPAVPKTKTPGGTAAPTEAPMATPPTEKSPDTQTAGGPPASTEPSQSTPAPTEKPSDTEDKQGEISATVLPVNPSASPVQPPQTDTPQSPITQEQVQNKTTRPSPQTAPPSSVSQTTVKTEKLTTLQPTSPRPSSTTQRASTAAQQTPSRVITPQTEQARTTLANEGRRTTLLNTLKPTKSTISTADHSKSTSSPDVAHTQESVMDSTTVDESEHLNSNSTSHVMGPEPGMPEAALPTLITILLFGALITGVVAFIVGRRCYESWQRRHYHKVDYLIEGLYN